MKAIIDYIFDLEEITYPRGGRDGYHRDETAFGNRHPFTKGWLVFWWRQLWHLITGLIMGIPFSFIGFWHGPIFCLGFFVAKEWYNDRRNLGLEYLGFKEYADIFFHVLGAILTSLLFIVVRSWISGA